MKKTLLALAVLAISGSAFATGYTSPGSVKATVSSAVNGSAGSYSVANGVNQVSAHGAFATATNEVCVTGDINRGLYSSSATTGATSNGSTMTGAGGIGLGGSSAYAEQLGHGSVTATVKSPYYTTQVADSVTNSTVGVGTWSGASNLNSGAALSGSSAHAVNIANVAVGVKFSCNGLCTTAKGTTIGADTTKTWGSVIGGNETVGAGGLWEVNKTEGVGSFQNGSFSGNVKVTNASL